MAKFPLFATLACLFSLMLVFGSCKKDNPVTNYPPRVNAGPAQTITEPIDSISVSGTVTDEGRKITAYLWSEVSGPGVPVIADEGSVSTKIYQLLPGTYIFQLMAVDTLGLTGVDTMRVTVNPPAIVTLAPVNNPFEFDYIGTGTNTDESAGPSSLELGAETWTIGGNIAYVRAAFGFDLSGLALNVPIKSAQLTLYSDPTPSTGNLTTPNAGPANAMYIRRIITAWSPSTTTWPTQPSTDTAGQVLIPQTNLSSLDLTGIDVTALVQKMISSGNNGFMIQLQNEVTYNSRIFCSSKYSDSSKRPRLVINY